VPLDQRPGQLEFIVEREYQLSIDQVRAALRQMRTAGLVTVEGRGRGGKWRAVQPDGSGRFRLDKTAMRPGLS